MRPSTVFLLSADRHRRGRCASNQEREGRAGENESGCGSIVRRKMERGRGAQTSRRDRHRHRSKTFWPAFLRSKQHDRFSRSRGASFLICREFSIVAGLVSTPDAPNNASRRGPILYHITSGHGQFSTTGTPQKERAWLPRLKSGIHACAAKPPKMPADNGARQSRNVPVSRFMDDLVHFSGGRGVGRKKNAISCTTRDPRSGYNLQPWFLHPRSLTWSFPKFFAFSAFLTASTASLLMLRIAT